MKLHYILSRPTHVFSSRKMTQQKLIYLTTGVLSRKGMECLKSNIFTHIFGKQVHGHRNYKHY
jgi:hypothetical protein